MHVSSRKGFTLIELLVVIAIIAVLAVVVVLTLNPAELLRQARDSNRVSDMATLNNALGIYSTDQSGASSFSLGSSNVVYISIPDPSATSTAGDQCQGLNLISLPATYTYHCAASSTFRNVNGTGWIPVNLASTTTGSPLGALPVDQINSSSSRLYYTYTTNGTNYEVTSVMESQKYGVGGSNDVISGDGGPLASVYEKGSKLGLEPLDYGDPTLVGYWALDEGTGTVAYDYSGNNATGTWNGTAAGTNGYYSAGNVASYAGTFNGSNNYVSVPITTTLEPTAVTIAMWMNEPTVWGGYETIGNSPAAPATGYNMVLNGGYLDWNINNGATRYELALGPVPSGWVYLVGTFTGSIMHFYINAQEVSGSPISATLSYTSPHFYIGSPNSPVTTNYIDDVRVYNRALSAAQVTAMYDNGK
jgi:prepilin-type N-terminal cleavage/methylation domain-containing protein